VKGPSEDLEDFRSENLDNLFEDADGDLAYLGLSDYRLERTVEEWPRLTFASTKEHTSERE
jgi:peptide chain release factor 3